MSERDANAPALDRDGLGGLLRVHAWANGLLGEGPVPEARPVVAEAWARVGDVVRAVLCRPRDEALEILRETIETFERKALKLRLAQRASKKDPAAASRLAGKASTYEAEARALRLRLPGGAAEPGPATILLDCGKETGRCGACHECAARLFRAAQAHREELAAQVEQLTRDLAEARRQGR